MITHYIFRRTHGIAVALPADLIEREAEHVTLEGALDCDFMATWDNPRFDEGRFMEAYRTGAKS